MPRTIEFWETRRKATVGILTKIEKALRENPPDRRAPRRRGKGPFAPAHPIGGIHKRYQMRYLNWKRSRAQWKNRLRKADKLRRRVAYCDLQIARLKTKTAWSHIRHGGVL